MDQIRLRPEELPFRKPVWEVFSTLFLDTHVSVETLEQMAVNLIQSTYTWPQLEHIFKTEVFPALHSNLMQTAGEPWGFDSDWLEQEIMQHIHLHTTGQALAIYNRHQALVHNQFQQLQQYYLKQLSHPVVLKPFSPIHFDTLCTQVTSPELLFQFGGPLFSFPLTPAQLITYLNMPQTHAFAVFSNQESYLGHAELHVADASSLKIGRLLIANPAQRGKGWGKHVLLALARFAILHYPGYHFILNVFDWNVPAIGLYQKMGFTFNGIELNREFNGEMHRALQMEADPHQIILL